MMATLGERTPRKRWLSLGAAGIGLLMGAVVQAQTAPEVPAGTVAPNLGNVKDVVAGSIKDAVGANRPATAAAPPPQDPAALQARLTVLRRKVLRDEDFVENEDSNRDPFRSYLRLFIEKTAPKARQIPAVFDKFALEELALIAVISGDANPRAMFRDPGGLGQVVKRGDYISKGAARITKILSDRVIVEQTEIMATGETHPSEKAILVNPEAAQK